MKAFLKFFKSVRLAIFLIIAITIASVIGTLIPQQRSAAEYAARYGQFSPLLIRMEFTNLYHSWWYIILLFLFSLNISVCTINRLSSKFRRAFRPTMNFTKKTLIGTPLHVRLRKNLSLEKTEAALKKKLSKKHYQLQENTKEESVRMLARKKILGLFGSEVVHLGLLAILLGGIISGLGGFGFNTKILEGEIVPVFKAGFKLRLDKFETEYYANGAVKDWKSTLTVIEKEKPVLTKTIEVNHPLSYNGYMFYQSSFGWDWTNPLLEIRIKKASDPSFLKTLRIRLGETFNWKEGHLEISILRFVPDFIINENRQVTTRSSEPHNPAAFVEAKKSGEKIFSGWIFAKFPDFSEMHESSVTDLKLELSDVKAAQYSGIQVSKDPGANVIWFGCAVLMLGLCLAFYWPTREIRFILEKGSSGTEIIAAGRAAKSKVSFQSEFEKIVTFLRKSK